MYPRKITQAEKRSNKLGLYTVHTLWSHSYLKFALPLGRLQYVKELYLTVCHTWSRILFLLIQPIISLLSGVLIIVKAVVVPETPCCVQCGCLNRCKWLCIGVLCELCSFCGESNINSHAKLLGKIRAIKSLFDGR